MAIDRSLAALKYVKTEKKQGDISDIPFTGQVSGLCHNALRVIEHLPVAVYENALNELARISE